jgi:adenylosuccinate lyase
MHMAEDYDLVSKLSDEDRQRLAFRLKCFSPDDGKYGEKTRKLEAMLTPEAEWIAAANMQGVLLETRCDFGQATASQVNHFYAALPRFDPLNAALLEDDKRIRHDQIAVLTELGRHIHESVVALLHPGTTSYDILDTIRAYLVKQAWYGVVRPVYAENIRTLCDLGLKSLDVIQVGRTHLQDTTPVSFGAVLIQYARRQAERMEFTDYTVDRLRGKVSGIVGTGAGVAAVVGRSKAERFERAVLKKMGLEPDTTATQITQKERLADVGHSMVTSMCVLADFAEDMRKLYSSAIQEVTSRDNKDRLGGSSADALKNNPIDWENIAGKRIVVESGMLVMYEMILTDFQRDLRGSVQNRYQPGPMIVQLYESLQRCGKCLGQLSVNYDMMASNLTRVRKNPSEAMVAILRGEGFVHTTYGEGHHFVKEIGKTAIREQAGLLEVALRDPTFQNTYDRLPDHKRMVLEGDLTGYLGHSISRARKNAKEAIQIAERQAWQYRGGRR